MNGYFIIKEQGVEYLTGKEFYLSNNITIFRCTTFIRGF